MTYRMTIAALAFMFPLFANASCDAVKADIDAKLKANGVGDYRLNVVDADQAGSNDGKVVGQCEGTKAIVYSRGPSQSGDASSNAAPVQAPTPMRSGQTGG